MHYRLYSLNPATGGIIKADHIAAATDSEAIRLGRETHSNAPFEIWCKSRRVFTTGKPEVGALV